MERDAPKMQKLRKSLYPPTFRWMRGMADALRPHCFPDESDGRNKSASQTGRGNGGGQRPPSAEAGSTASLLEKTRTGMADSGLIVSKGDALRRNGYLAQTGLSVTSVLQQFLSMSASIISTSGAPMVSFSPCHSKMPKSPLYSQFDQATEWASKTLAIS
jgi:hypothetical protein